MIEHGYGSRTGTEGVDLNQRSPREQAYMVR